MTALFPYLILVILLVRAATLPGYMDGITFYLTPQWERLADIRVWADACTQIFFSLGVTWGVMITLASYNKFNNNVFRDAIMVAIGNCCTSVFAGFVIFGIIGFMAHELGKPVKDVVTEGEIKVRAVSGNILSPDFEFLICCPLSVCLLDHVVEVPKIKNSNVSKDSISVLYFTLFSAQILGFQPFLCQGQLQV